MLHNNGSAEVQVKFVLFVRNHDKIQKEYIKS